MITDAEARAFAQRLRSAEFDGVAAPLATETFDDLGADGARAIARARDQLRRDDGDTLIGYKLGWTSAAMREALGIDRPNWGTLWRSQYLDGQLAMATLRHAKVEPELVYLAGAELSGAEVTSGDADLERCRLGGRYRGRASPLGVVRFHVARQHPPTTRRAPRSQSVGRVVSTSNRPRSR